MIKLESKRTRRHSARSRRRHRCTSTARLFPVHHLHSSTSRMNVIETRKIKCYLFNKTKKCVENNCEKNINELSEKKTDIRAFRRAATTP